MTSIVDVTLLLQGGGSILGIGLLLAAFFGVLSGALWLIARWNGRNPVPLTPR